MLTAEQHRSLSHDSSDRTWCWPATRGPLKRLAPNSAESCTADSDQIYALRATKTMNRLSAKSEKAGIDRYRGSRIFMRVTTARNIIAARLQQRATDPESAAGPSITLDNVQSCAVQLTFGRSRDLRSQVAASLALVSVGRYTPSAPARVGHGSEVSIRRYGHNSSAGTATDLHPFATIGTDWHQSLCHSADRSN
jgi:hypothetical protein